MFYKKLIHFRNIFVFFSVIIFVIVLASNTSFLHQVLADVPLAARLLSEPYASTGTRVQITNFNSMRGLANDGTNVYVINSSGNVYTIPFSSITISAGGSVSVPGTSHTVGWGSGGAPSVPDLSATSLAYSHGCLFITDGTNTEGSIQLYCIDVSDYSVTKISVPIGHPLPEGNYYVKSSLIDFPDGRIGKVSKYVSVTGGYESTLRTYMISGNGKNATITWSEDYIMSDTNNWAVDEHGIATDGTYLYRIQYKSISPGYKVWQLQSGSTASVYYSDTYTQPYDNMHFLSHNHTSKYYLVGYWDNTSFFITSEADPGPGPGNSLTPTFGTPTSTAGGFTVQISNYDSNFNWSGSATAGGSVNINSSGLVTVTGLASNTSSTVTITTTRSGYPNGSANVTGTSLTVTPTPTPAPTSTPTPTPTATPTPTPSSSSTSSSSRSNSSSSSCSTQKPSAAPNLFQISTSPVRATLYFTPVNPATGYIISYGTNSSANQYSVSFDYTDGGGAVTYTINSLSPVTTYTFKVQAKNGCATGDWSQLLSQKTTASPSQSVANTLLPIPTSIPHGEIKVIDKQQKNVPKPTPTEVQTNQQSSNGYDVEIFVKKNGKPVEGATVELHSIPRRTTTDKNGIARFTDVEKGEHAVYMAYEGYTGKDKIKLDSENKRVTVNLSIELRPYNNLLVGGVIVLVTVLIITIVLLLFFLKRRKKNSTK
jgi:hypothetical protein